jgi:hypothetical protein
LKNTLAGILQCTYFAAAIFGKFLCAQSCIFGRLPQELYLLSKWFGSIVIYSVASGFIYNFVFHKVLFW